VGGDHEPSHRGVRHLRDLPVNGPTSREDSALPVLSTAGFAAVPGEKVKRAAGAGEQPHGSTGRVKHILLSAVTALAFALGTYSLVLASTNAGMAHPLPDNGLLRTAVASDREKIDLALGPMPEAEVVFLVIDAPTAPPDPEVERAAREAARTLVDSGTSASARRLQPSDPSFTAITKQNDIRRFPAILVVKKAGGIVLVTEDHGAENLVRAFQTTLGRRADCGAARDGIY